MHEVADEHLLENILSENDNLAKHNREHFNELRLLTLNIMSAPGAGKTTLLEATLNKIATVHKSAVIEGDMFGELDKERLSKIVTDIKQINTGRSCHLDARMIARLLHSTDYSRKEILFIENVGNLVCPAEFPLGEHRRVVLFSVTEGDDKPIKYPVIFRNCDVIVITKLDLLSYVDFDLEKAQHNIQALNKGAKIFTLSAKTGAGFNEWINWLEEELKRFELSLPKELNIHC